MIFAVFLLCGFSAAIAIRTLDPLTVDVAADLMVPVSSVVLLASAAALPCALAQPVLGPVGDHFGKSRVLKIALWVSAASLAAGALANDLAMLALSRMLTGVAGAGLIPVAMAMVGDRYKKARQVAIARFVASAIIGQIMGAVFAGMLADVVGWRGVMWLCCGIVMFSALAATLLLNDEPANAGRGRFGFQTGMDIYRRIFRNPRSWTCYSTVFATGAFTFGFLPFVAPILQMQDNGGAREAGIIIAGMAAGALVFSLALPLFLKFVSRPTLMAMGGLVGCAGFLAFSTDPHWSLQAAFFSVVGLGFFMVHNSVQAEVAEIEPDARSSCFAMHACFFYLGQTAGPLLWSLAIAMMGAQGAITLMAFAVAATGLAASAAFRRLPKIVSGAL
ncbi:MAG: MFS transporter [Beijerinckiaceae bacterium]|nr:MFS transporter [Beijerinckiaceae bacterium]